MMEIRAFLLEDDEGDAALIRSTLRRLSNHMRLRVARRLSDAIACLEKESFDVILCDLSVPDSEGLPTVEAIHSAAENTPIIVLTGHDDDGLATRALRKGAQDYLPKCAATPESLGRSIRYAIERQQQLIRTKGLLAEVVESREILAAQNLKLEKLYKQGQDIVDNVSHEFRTPLTVIREFASLLHDEIVGPISDEQRRMLSIIEERCDDLNTMVDDMLDAGRVEAGVLGAWRKPCQLAEILDQLEPVLARKAKLNNVTLQIEMAPHLPTVFCDPEKAARVILNLSTNAVKFCGDPGEVRITARQHGDAGVVLEVSDNGTGIEKENLDKIFARYKQLSPPPRGSCKGFGLGLNIARELAELNLGQLDVDSELGSGSTFWFTVPLHDANVVTERYLSRLENKVGTGGRVSILVASTESTNFSRDVEAMLHTLMQCDDLLFPITSSKWLIVLPRSRHEVQQFLDAAQETWRSAARNRPFGPLPKVDYEWLGTWCLPESRETIIREAVHACPHREASHAVANLVS